MVKKLRVSLALQPVATALFANSPFTDGKPNGFLSLRSEIWRDTDNARTGMLPFAFEPGMGFERYVDYALDVPMYFVKRGDSYHRRRRRNRSATCWRASCRNCRASARRSRTGPTTSRRFSRRCGSSAISKCAAPMAVRGGGCRACRPSGSASSTTRRRSMPPGTSSRTGPPRSARSCATTCRRRASLRPSATATCSSRRRDAQARARGAWYAALEECRRRRRDPISRTARGPRGSRLDAGGGIAREVSRAVGRIGGAGLHRIRLLSARDGKGHACDRSAGESRHRLHAARI